MEMNLKQQLQFILKELGEDYRERSGVPIRFGKEKEWYQLAPSIECETCNGAYNSIGQGTEIYWCKRCQRLDRIQFTVSPHEEGSWIIAVKKPMPIKGFATN